MKPEALSRLKRVLAGKLGLEISQISDGLLYSSLNQLEGADRAVLLGIYVHSRRRTEICEMFLFSMGSLRRLEEHATTRLAEKYHYAM